MGITVVVFEEQLAPTDRDLWAWIRAERAAEPKGAWQRPETSSNVLSSWVSEMRATFPPLADAVPDDLHGTDYSFYKHFIYIVFAGPVGEEGVVTAWKLAHRHGLRVLVGDELLPPAAPEGERQIHITALDGDKVRTRPAGARNVCIAILDPAFAPAAGARQWILDQLDIENGSDDPSLAMTSSRLKQWHDDFSALHLSCVLPETRFFEKFILLRLHHPKDLDQVAPAAISSAKELRLGLLLFENL
jgi:hypothetical protein